MLSRALSDKAKSAGEQAAKIAFLSPVVVGVSKSAVLAGYLVYRPGTACERHKASRQAIGQ